MKTLKKLKRRSNSSDSQSLDWNPVGDIIQVSFVLDVSLSIQEFGELRENLKSLTQSSIFHLFKL